MKEKIYVYRRSYSNGKLSLVEEYENSKDFGDKNSEDIINSNFRESDSDRVNGKEIVYGYCLTIRDFAFVAYNEKGKLLPRSQLIGYARDAAYRRSAKWDKDWNFKSMNRGAYGSFRYPKSTQEKRWAHAWDDEEDCPPVRGRRQGKYLPDAWNDHWSKSHKSWKKQSNRKHQWRVK
jgi:hypothetical protein